MPTEFLKKNSLINEEILKKTCNVHIKHSYAYRKMYWMFNPKLYFSLLEITAQTRIL